VSPRIGGTGSRVRDGRGFHTESGVAVRSPAELSGQERYQHSQPNPTTNPPTTARAIEATGSLVATRGFARARRHHSNANATAATNTSAAGAPYPVEVGTAITPQVTRPPMTLARRRVELRGGADDVMGDVREGG
jgi:hypothetical protein